jgi:hypothetical protein
LLSPHTAEREPALSPWHRLDPKAELRDFLALPVPKRSRAERSLSHWPW